jgi:hypothetical protein
MNIHAPCSRRDQRGATMTIPGFPRVALVLVAGLTAGCVKQLPPAPTPQPVAPRVDAPPPPDGYGRLVIDVVEGPTRIHRVQMQAEQRQDDLGRVSYQLTENPEPLCPTSPCTTDVPPGNLLLGFPVIGDPGAMETELVHVGPGTSVYRRSLSVYDGGTGGLRTMGIIGTSVGGAALITGIVLLPIGLSDDSDGLTTAGAISLGAGAAVLTLGILAIRRDSPTFRPGASNHFSF